MKPMRRIRKARIKFLSLVPKGANGMKTLYKQERNGQVDFEIRSLTKAGDNFEEQGELLSVVYAPELRDAEGDIASAEVIKEALYEAAREGLKIDLRHNEQPLAKTDAFVAEQFIIQKGDPRFVDFKDYDGNPVDVTGGWGVVLKIENPELREKYRNGEWQGVSMGGVGMVEVEKESASRSLLQQLAEVLGLRHSYAHQSVTLSGDIDMTGEELIKTLKDNNESLTKGLVDGLAKILKPDAETPPATAVTKEADADKAPTFTGDPLKLADVKKHEQAIKAFHLRKSVDWSDPEAVSKYQAELAKQQGTTDTNDEPASDREMQLQKEIEERDAELAQIRRRSSQNLGSDDTAASLSKEVQECNTSAEAMIKYLQGRA